MLKMLIAICVATIVLGAFLFLNADGNPVYLARAPLYSHNPNYPSFPGFEVDYQRIRSSSLIPNRIHGWPIAGLLRVGVLPVAYKGEQLPKAISGPIIISSRWPFDKAPWDHTKDTALAVNALIMAIVTIDVLLAINRLLTKGFRFSISMLLKVILIAAVISVLRDILFTRLDWQERTAVIIVSVCILATAIRLILGSIRMVLNRLRRPKHEPVAELSWSMR